MKKLWIGIIGIVVVALVVILIVMQTRREAKEIKIGAILPLTGDAGFYGESIKKGIEIGVEEINKMGGIKGKKLIVLYEDSKGLPSEGISAFNKLVKIHKVSCVIGDAISSVTLAIAPIAEKNKVVVLSPLSSAPAITNAGDFIFRNVPSDLFGGKVAAYFAVRDQKWRSLGILYINNDFGVGLKDVFLNTVNSLGGKIVITEAYEPGSTDFRTHLMKIKQAHPDAVFLIGYREVPQILIQTKEIGLNVKFLGTGLIEDPYIVKVAKDAAEGVFFTQLQYTPDSPKLIVKKFVQNFEKKYGIKPNIISAYGYDALKVLAFAMERSNLNSEDIKKNLYNIKKFEGVTGEISFDENGDVIQPMGVKIIKNGKFMWFKEEIFIE
jgi:branched-chain amino acid transport system substrate-binding protein